MSTRKRLEPMSEPMSFLSVNNMLPGISRFSPMGTMPTIVAVPRGRTAWNACSAVSFLPMASKE